METSSWAPKPVTLNLSPVDLLWGQKLRLENANLQKRFSGFETSVITLRERIEELETTTMRRTSILERDNTNLREEVGGLVCKNLRLTAEMEQSASKIEQLASENQMLKERVQRTEHVAHCTSKFQDQTNESVALVSRRLCELQLKIEDLKNELVDRREDRKGILLPFRPHTRSPIPLSTGFLSRETRTATHQNHAQPAASMQSRTPSPPGPSTRNIKSRSPRQVYQTATPAQERRSVYCPLQSRNLGRKRRTLISPGRPLVQEGERVYCPPQPKNPRKRRTLNSPDGQE
ncbi:MAG: hypothetical protein M1813_008076 [Trichoglossum hirsutum]|nr:MAG: hypothetical protein M1813_008076 [Trichoglossum hirsutum]